MSALRVLCDECGSWHEATYSHEGRFGEGPIFAVVCSVDSLTDYYQAERVAVVVTRFRQRFTTCASCRAEALWMVGGSTACERHRELWERRAKERR